MHIDSAGYLPLWFLMLYAVYSKGFPCYMQRWLYPVIIRTSIISSVFYVSCLYTALSKSAYLLIQRQTYYYTHRKYTSRCKYTNILLSVIYIVFFFRLTLWILLLYYYVLLYLYLIRAVCDYYMNSYSCLPISFARCGFKWISIRSDRPLWNLLPPPAARYGGSPLGI